MAQCIVLCIHVYVNGTLEYINLTLHVSDSSFIIHDGLYFHLMPHIHYSYQLLLSVLKICKLINVSKSSVWHFENVSLNRLNTKPLHLLNVFSGLEDRCITICIRVETLVSWLNRLNDCNTSPQIPACILHSIVLKWKIQEWKVTIYAIDTCMVCLNL